MSSEDRRPILRGERVYLREADRPIGVVGFLSIHLVNGGAELGTGIAERPLWDEGTLRGALYRQGRNVDARVRSILRDEWSAQVRPRTWEPDWAPTDATASSPQSAGDPG